MVHVTVNFIVHTGALKSGIDRLHRTIPSVCVLTLEEQYAHLCLLARPEIHILPASAAWDELRELWRIRNYLEGISCK